MAETRVPTRVKAAVRTDMWVWLGVGVGVALGALLGWSFLIPWGLVSLLAAGEWRCRG